MPERVEELKSLVKELEAALETLDSADAESQQTLAEALRDLRAALDKVDSEPIASDTLVARFRAAEEDFQVSHPTVSGLVLRMIDALGQLGI
jgi:chromosome segregation ATPase